MSALLDRSTLFVREHVGMFKAANAYDLLDPRTTEVVGRVQERVGGAFRRLLKFTSWKTKMSFHIEFHDLTAGDAVVLVVSRPFTWFRSVVTVADGAGRILGTFRQKLLAWGPKMFVLAPDGRQLAELKGDWKGWNYTFTDASDRVLGTVTKKWAGVGRELFTSADNYMIDVAPECTDPALRALLFAAPITADMVYKEYA
jgi:uncharacterized protein YxjI